MQLSSSLQLILFICLFLFENYLMQPENEDTAEKKQAKSQWTMDGTEHSKHRRQQCKTHAELSPLYM